MERACLRLVMFILIGIGLLYCTPLYGSGSLIIEKDIDGNGTTELILENRYFRLVVEPELGGAGTSFIYKKTGEELLIVTPGHIDTMSGLFQDNIVQKDGMRDFTKAFYSFRILKNDQEEGIVELSCIGVTGELSWITIKKTFHIYADRSSVIVDYEYMNNPSSKATISYGFWVHNQIGIKGKLSNYFLPRSFGIEVKSEKDPKNNGQFFAYDASRGWFGVISEDKHGAVLQTEYPYLMCLYGGFFSNVNTQEWMNRSLPIKCGESLKSRAYFSPFQGLSTIEGANSGLAGSIEVKEKYQPGKSIPVSISLVSDRNRDVDISFQYKIIPEEEWKTISSKFLSLKVDEQKTCSVSFTSQQSGTCIFRVKVSKDNKEILNFEKPFIIGASSGKYFLAPVEKRLGDPNERFGEITSEDTLKEDITLFDNIKSSHIPWATPYYRGRVRALILTARHSQREIIELSQRMSLDFDTITLTPSFWFSAAALTAKGWSVDDQIKLLKKKLSENQYDVILIGDLSRTKNEEKFIAEEILSLLLERVKNGTGLIWLGTSPLAKLPVSYQKKMGFSLIHRQSSEPMKIMANWHKKNNHFITNGVPFEILPASLFTSINIPEEKILATLITPDDKVYPLIAATNYGEGRIVYLTYNAGSIYNKRLGKIGRGCALIPSRPYLTNTKSITDSKIDKDRYISFDYYEYYNSLLIRAVIWAGNKETELSALLKPSMAAFNNNEELNEAVIEISVKNKREPANMEFELTLRDEFSEEIAVLSKSELIPSGESSMNFSLPSDKLGGGMYFADLIIRNGGKVVNWGTATFSVKRPVIIEEIHVDGEEPLSTLVKGKVILQTGMPAKTRISFSLIDSYNRLISQQIEEIQLNSGKTAIAYSLPLEKIFSQVGFLECEVYRNEKKSMKLRRRFIVKQNFVWDDFLYLMYMYPRTKYYFPYYLDELKKVGVQAFFVPGGGDLIIDKDFPVLAGSILPESGFHYHHSTERYKLYKEMKKQYKLTRDKKYLIREPCINDPEFKKECLDNLHRLISRTKNYNLIAYDISDETSLTRYGDAFDFCFSSHCLNAFRKWIRGQYGSLKALNEEWGTSFSDWEDIIPMTFDEAGAKKNFSSWADHRRFMECSLYNLFDSWLAELKKLRPGAELSQSGTQPGRAYGGDDIWLRTQRLGYVMAYSEENQRELQISFNQDMKIAPWKGYGGSGSVWRRDLWRDFLLGCRGLAFWQDAISLNADFNHSPSTLDVKEVVTPLQCGLGKLLRPDNRLYDRIAILYSQSSIRAGFILGEAHIPAKIRDTWLELLSDIGLSGRFISYEQLAKGILQKDDYRVLILPYAVALSDNEITRIKRFVKNGGTVIADMKAGIMDGHCKNVNLNQLDEVFGIRHLPFNQSLKQLHEVTINKNIEGFEEFKGSKIPVRAAEGNIMLNKGTSLFFKDGYAPVIILNFYGKGKGIYLNLDITKYSGLRMGEAGRGDGLKDILNRVFVSAGIERKVKVIDRKTNNDLRHCQIFSFSEGKALYLALLPDWDGKEKRTEKQIKIVVPEQSYFYDILAGKYLGRMSNLEAEIGLEDVTILAVLPYQTKSISVTADKERYKRGETINYKIAISPETGKCVVRLEVIAPDKKAIPYYSKNLIFNNGKVEGKIDLALNEDPGKWLLQVKDVATGLNAGYTFTITGTSVKTREKTASYQGPIWKTDTSRHIVELPAMKKVEIKKEVSNDFPNILQNPFFTKSADGKVPFWRVFVSPGLAELSIEPSTEVKYKGVPSIKITSKRLVAGEKIYWTLTQSLRHLIPELRGKTVKLSGYVCRTDKPIAGAYEFVFRMRQFGGPASKFLGDVITLYQTRILPGKWHRFEVVGKVVDTDELRSMDIQLGGSFFKNESMEPDVRYLADIKLIVVEPQIYVKTAGFYTKYE